MANITAYKNTPLKIDINLLANNNSTGEWSISQSILHNNNLGSYADKTIPELIKGDTYRITYTVSSYNSCNFRVYLGDTAGTIRTSVGTFTEILEHTGSINRLRFWSNGNVTISYYKIEHLATIVNEQLIDTTIENNSWTLSYDLNLKQWVSFHSYLPNNYIQNPIKLLTKRNDTDIKVINSSDFGKYFDSDIKPFIIETIFNEAPLSTKVFDSIHCNLNSTINDISTNKFFDKSIIYNEYQITGVITLDTTNLTKKERDWSFNKFSDITNSTSNSLFVKDWNSIKQAYPIDKVINVNKINNSKPWFERGRMRDKYLAVRFIENNFDNQKIMCNFVITYYRASQR